MATTTSPSQMPTIRKDLPHDMSKRSELSASQRTATLQWSRRDRAIRRFPSARRRKAGRRTRLFLVSWKPVRLVTPIMTSAPKQQHQLRRDLSMSVNGRDPAMIAITAPELMLLSVGGECPETSHRSAPKRNNEKAGLVVFKRAS